MVIDILLTSLFMFISS